jgi:predicted anti-sigma-YlaC factor YlaD
MKCEQVQAVLAIAPREWSEAERQQVAAHMQTCTACAALARDYARQASRLMALPRPGLSTAQQQAIFAQAARLPRHPWSRRLVNALGTAAGVLILGALIVALLWAFSNPASLSLTATVTRVLTPTLTSTPTSGPASPTPASPAPAPPTVILPNGAAGAMTPMTLDPIYATQAAVYRATSSAGRAVVP